MVAVKVNVAYLTFIRPRHVFIIFLVISIILISLLLAGCSSSFSIIPNIYLLHVAYNDGTVYQISDDSTIVNPAISTGLAGLVGVTTYEVRIGFFGICMTNNPASWLCSENATALAEQLTAAEDPLNILHLAQTFREKIVFPYLLIAAAALAFIVFVLILPYPPLLKSASTFVCFLSTLLILISVLWQHTASVSASSSTTSITNGVLTTGVGANAMILGWFSFALMTITVIGIYFFVTINSRAETVVIAE
ncbi:Ca2+ regulator and membrane fusion protein Fig1-domain-containing protein [Dipodascopsis uninucleata]